MLPEHRTEQVEIIPRVGWRDDDEDIRDARRDERVDRIENHLPIIHRQELLRDDRRERQEPCPSTASKNDTLHRKSNYDFTLRRALWGMKEIFSDARDFRGDSEEKISFIPRLSSRKNTKTKQNTTCNFQNTNLEYHKLKDCAFVF